MNHKFLDKIIEIVIFTVALDCSHTVSDVPWNSTEEDLARICRILVDLRRKLTAPGAGGFVKRFKKQYEMTCSFTVNVHVHVS